MSQKYKRYTDVTSLDRDVIYHKYNSRTGGKPSMYLSRKEVNLIVKCIFKHMAKSIVNAGGGLLMKGFGYFFQWKSPRKIIKKGILPDKSKLATNYHTDGYIYYPTLMTGVFDKNLFDGWSMDKSFNDDLKRDLAKKHKAGKKYTMNYTLLRRIFNKQFQVDEF